MKYKILMSKNNKLYHVQSGLQLSAGRKYLEDISRKIPAPERMMRRYMIEEYIVLYETNSKADILNLKNIIPELFL